MTVTPLSFQADIATYALNSMTHTQRQFRKNPSSTNWQMVLRSMLVYQQVTTARIDKQRKIIDAVTALPMGDWDEAIVQAVLGMTISEVI
jgi:hypothetical protein